MKTNWIVICSLILSLVIACNESKRKVVEQSKVVKHDSIVKKILPQHLTIDSLLNNLDWWYTVKGNATIFFLNDTLIYNFSFSCANSCPAKIEANKIIIYWAHQLDCTTNMNIKKSFGLKNKPVVGKPFAEMSIINDTTVSMEYLYPEWVKAFNENGDDPKDTLFPVIFYRIYKGSARD